ncbi:MAG: hypothetical protein JWR15_373 [Prosthecobacter sp.]|nr:hypothetical protein [Prosthecobacter sp.]
MTMPGPTPSAPDAAAARSWVWHATVESRAAGLVSVLACGETLLAVALYWWIAIRWDTHWHLLTSVFIAPLLLLRSPESMKLGVRWFLKDWFGFEDYKEWPRARRWLWQGLAAVLSGLATYAFARWLCGLWLVGQAGWALWGWSALIGCLSIILAVAVAVVFVGERGQDGKAAAANVIATATAIVIGVAVAIGCADGGSIAGSVIGVVVGIIAAWAVGTGEHAVGVAIMSVVIGAQLSLNSLVFRVAATLRHLPHGLCHVAENWQENNFWVDFCVPAELMPGIREERASLCLDGLARGMREEEGLIWKWVMWPLLAVTIFLPAFLYRLNIKATCWFWWPLAYLLKPVSAPQSDQTGLQKHALCWPWDDPWQRLLIFVPAALMCAVLIDRYSDFGMWQQYQNPDAVSVPLKLLLGMQWSHLPPWHVAMLFIASSGLGMLAISGAACGHKRNDNWDSYAQSGMSKHLWMMNALTKVRSLAAKAFMLLGLGMCLISFPEWRQHLPGTLLQRLERFYHD